MAYPGLAHEDHKYLGKEYCTGYTDVYGKWNTGFYCPQYGSKTAVFCCGTAVFKYCCTNQEPIDLTSSNGGVLLDGDDPNFDHPHGGVSSAVFVRVPIVFGVVCGITAVLILLAVAGCYFCSCCFAYKKRRNDMMSDPQHHHLHLNHHQQLPQFGPPGNSGAGANLLNLYSPGTTTGPLTNRSSLVTTPLDLDWTSSIASSYQSQQQLYAPLQFPAPPGSSPGLSPAAAAIAAALTQRSPAGSSLLYGTPVTSGVSGTPSVISGSVPATSQGPGRLPAPQAYQGYLNSSTSTLSSVPPTASLPRGNNPGAGQQLHRGNLPQQMTTTASIVNSYLASLQQAQLQTHTPPEQQPPPPVVQVERRHPSPPPSYFQSVSSASSYPNNRNSTGNNRNSNVNNSSNRTSRMATVQTILGGSNSGGNSYSGFNLNSEEDLLIADFILRHENTLRRTLGLSNNSSNSVSNNRTNNNSRNHRGNPMLSQRELIELLLRLTCNNNSSTSSITRSDSGVGSDSNSTASSVTTTRSTSSSSGKHPTSTTTPATPNNKSVTISEVDEDNDNGQEVGSVSTNTRNVSGNHPVSGKIKASLDLALSRMSVVENDSGVPSSTCSTAGSEGAESVIGSIKMISRDLSEEAIKLNKQHALDDDSSCVGGSDDGSLTRKFQQQLAASAIHTETNCTNDGIDCGGSDGEIMVMESSNNHPSPPIPGERHPHSNSNNGGRDADNGGSVIFSTGSSNTCENPISPPMTTPPAQEV